MKVPFALDEQQRKMAEAFQKKMIANYGRPFKHGKHF